MAESKELDVRGAHGPALTYDPSTEPSAAWGWHGTFPRSARVGGWATAAILLLMMIGNHRGHVEDLWLAGLAVVVVVVLVRDQLRRRTSWRR